MTPVALIDTHAHLNDGKFAGDLDEVIGRASAAGVTRIVVCGYDIPSSRDAVTLSDRYGGVFATVGVHPHDARSYNPGSEAELRELSRHPKVIAIGEIGLDYHYDFSPRDAQLAAFDAQVRLAGEIGLPVVVHSRESNPQALQVLTSSPANIVGCVFHCFSGDEHFAREVLGMGFYIGIDGPITYKASEKLRRVVEACPADRLLLETDCPYLTPIPHRGHRNEPAYLTHIAEEVAGIKRVSVEEIAVQTSGNAERLFPRLIS